MHSAALARQRAVFCRVRRQLVQRHDEREGLARRQPRLGAVDIEALRVERQDHLLHDVVQRRPVPVLVREQVVIARNAAGISSKRRGSSSARLMTGLSTHACQRSDALCSPTQAYIWSADRRGVDKVRCTGVANRGRSCSSKKKWTTYAIGDQAELAREPSQLFWAFFAS